MIPSRFKMRNTHKKLIFKLSDNSPLSVCMSRYGYKLGCISLSKKHHDKKCKGKQKTSGDAIRTFLSKRRASRFTGDRDSSSAIKHSRILQKSCHNDGSHKRKRNTSLCSKTSKKRNRGKVEVQNFRKKKRKLGKKKDVNHHDEASRFQRRIRYLLIKLKMEQNLIDAYSAEGWKGQSREKIKPEKELERAEKQILKCKLGIRDVIRQLDILCSDGRIEDSVIDSDGRVFHEHIFCATCKMRDAFPNNDIILCDGTCNRAFHQKCLDPPLATENIPPEGEGWFCKYCDCKMDILEVINAHLCTQFSVNSSWQDIFTEAVNAPSGENEPILPEEAWPSDDSEDEDYNPQSNDKNCKSDCSRSDDSCWSYDEVSSLCEEATESDANEGLSSLQYTDGHYDMIALSDSAIDMLTNDNFDRETANFRRQRKNVDYQKLYNEMFGKDVVDNDQLSEDEDWGPGKKRKKVKESDEKLADQTNSEMNEVSNDSHQVMPSESQKKKAAFRIPADAVKKLRQVFVENELPSRGVRESLSQELGIATEKVTKWFKNARYMALRTRKQDGEPIPVFDRDKVHGTSEFSCGTIEGAKIYDAQVALLVDRFHVPKNIKRVRSERKPKSVIAWFMKRCKKTADTLSPNVLEDLKAVLSASHPPSMHVKRSLSKQLGIPYQEVNMCFKKHEQHKRWLMNQSWYINMKNKVGDKVLPPADSSFRDRLHIIQLQKLCHLKHRVEELQRHLRTCCIVSQQCNDNHSRQAQIVYVPFPDVREKFEI